MQSFFDYIKKEWAALIAAPWSFAGLTAVCLGAGFAAGMLYYSSQVGSLREQLNAKDGQLGRYRVALGMDPASKGALVELNNQELALKAQWLVLHLRQFRVELEE